jgi:IPT/TIG domain
MNRSFLVTLLLLACTTGDGLEPYYAGSPPSVSGASATSEAGNVGGGTLTINGSGFGDDPSQITVIFGSNNARVLSASDSAVEVEIPHGPLSGGPVTVRVGTPNGQVEAQGLYTYDMTNSADTHTFAENEHGYISIGNDWFSCYGGVGSDVQGCETFALTGKTGISGTAEVVEYPFPRLSGAFTGSGAGFADSATMSWGTWAVQKGPYEINSFDLQDAYADHRVEIGDFSLKNPILSEEDPFCSNLPAQTSYYYGGGDPREDGLYYQPYSLYTEDDLRVGSDCDAPGAKAYRLDTLNFCEVHDYDVPRPRQYEADWPIGKNFFMGTGSQGGANEDAPAQVLLNVPKAGLEGLPLVLPANPRFSATEGFAYSGEDEGELWAIGGSIGDDCADTNEDGRIALDDVAAAFEWRPSTAALADSSVDPRILNARVFVRATISWFSLGWFGGEGVAVKAVITVPDDHNYVDERGTSRLEIPQSVLMQFPTAKYSVGPQQSQFGSAGFTWGDPSRSDYAFMVVIMERVTEYEIATEFSELTGDQSVVLSYSTGDLGYLEYENPLDQDSCGNCQDDDGDGWIDDLDPDCEDGEENGATNGDTTCNDGEDNDEDGLVDSEDPDCVDGSDGETNCSDGEDNDEDGFTDEEDGECSLTGVEAGDDDPTWGCANGLDDDLDGWADLEDPDCTSSASDELGYGSTPCNDGLDNDGHGDVDRDDLYCLRRGALSDSEQPDFAADCLDGEDNDGDGYTDANDPDCEISPYAVETEPSRDDEGIAACYDGEDNDLDGTTDAADPDCVNEAGEADGFVGSEGEIVVLGGCENLSDDDGDGWTDLLDPDCQDGGTEELNLTSIHTCNDGLDNDGDLLIDAADTDSCTSGEQDTEVAP